MKALPIILGFWLLMLTQSLQSQTIYSTTSGGDWNDTLTWVGHEVPIWSNHVVINGPVTIQPDYWSQCMNLTISFNCSLTGGSVYAEELKVYGGITNYGTIESASGVELRILTRGNLMNYGSMDIKRLLFDAGNDKNFFSSTILMIDEIAKNDTSDIILTSDIQLDSCWMNIGSPGHGIFLNGYSLNLLKGDFTGRLWGNAGNLILTDDAKISNAYISGEVHLLGQVNLTGTNYFYGDIYNEGTLYNSGYYSYDNHFYGNLHNSGSIAEAPSLSFIVNLYQNFYNQGTVDIYRLSFMGSHNHSIESSNPLAIDNFYLGTSDTLTFLSDIELANSYISTSSYALININVNTFKMDNSTLVSRIQADGGTLWCLNNSGLIQSSFLDDIYLKGDVNIAGGGVHFYGSTEVLNSLQCNNYNGAEVYFHGQLLNSGTITDGTALTVYTYGDLINDGIISVNSLYFSGTDIQNLSTNQVLSPTYMYNSNTLGISMNTELKLSNTTLYGNNHAVYLQDFGALLDNVILSSAHVYSDTTYLHAINDGYINSCKFYGPIELKGIININGDGTFFYDETTLSDTLQRVYNYYSTSVNFAGNLINNGLITDNGLSINCMADLSNHGVINCNGVTMAGSGAQTLITSQAIQCDWFSSSDTTGYISAGSDLYFDHAPISLNGEQLLLNSYRLNLVGAYITSSSVSNGQLKLTDGAYASSVKYYDNIDLQGQFQVYGDLNLFYGPTTISDTLTCAYNYYGNTAHFYNQIINNGLIENNLLTTSLYHDAINNGIWVNGIIRFNAANNQTINTALPISATYIYVGDTTGMLLADNDLYFANSNLSLSFDDLHLNGHSLNLDNCTLAQAKIVANHGVLNGSNNASINACSFYSPVSLTGTVLIVGNGNQFYDETTVQGTLSCVYYYYGYTAYFYDDLINEGLIEGGTLTIESSGNIMNKGTWSNPAIYLRGTQTQHIDLINNHSINSHLYMYANVPGATTYNWNKNGFSLIGEPANQFLYENGEYLYSNLWIDNSYLGVYQCTTNAGNSRQIEIDAYEQLLSVDLGPDFGLCIGQNHSFESSVVNGVPPYSYLWSNGATSPSIIASSTLVGYYALTVTDANMNTAVDTVFFNALFPPQLDLPTEIEACDMQMLMPSVYDATFIWSTGQTMNHIMVDSTGLYSVTATGYNGCTAQDEVYVIINESPIIELGPDQLLTQGNISTLDAGPGMASYYWSTGETTQTIVVDTSGTYYIEIMDTLGCYASDQITINFNPVSNPLELSLPADTSICEGDEYLLEPAILNGTPPFTYLWSTGATTSFLWVSPSSSMTYSVTVTDAFGASASDEIMIQVNPIPLVSITGDNSSCAGQIEMLSATGVGSYLWSTGSTSNQIFIQETGTYMVTVTNQYNCATVSEHTITFFPAPSAYLGGDIETCSGDVVTLEASPGGLYYWSTGSTSSYINVTLSGFYSLTVSNALGCSSSDTIQVHFNPTPYVNIGPDMNVLEGTIVTLDAGAGFESYYWSNGDTTQTIEITQGGTYFVEVMNAMGCFGFDEMSLTTYQLNPNPGWTFENTGIMHTILIPDTCLITMDGVAIAIGDYIGVFYNDNGTLICGGYTSWTGQVNALTAWGDDEYTLNKDGFSVGETLTYKIWQAATGTSWDPDAVYMPLTVMPDQQSFAINGLSGLISLIATSVDYQYIQLPNNWSYFSTYIDLFEPNIEDLLAGIYSSVVIVKNGAGSVYWPQYGLNLINNLVIGQGYQIKITSAQTLVCEGQAVEPELTPISLTSNWNLIGYLRTSPASIVSMLSPIVNDIVIVKNTAGNSYWPMWNLNTIGNMKPGEGYLMKMTVPQILTYPSNNQTFKLESAQVTTPVHYKHAMRSEFMMTVCIPEWAWTETPKQGDEIAVFNSAGYLAGLAVYTGGTTGITLWQQEDGSSEGLKVNESFSFKVYSLESQQEVSMEVEYFEGKGMFEKNGLAVLKQATMKPNSISELQLALYPNPASQDLFIHYTSVSDANQCIRIYAVDGKCLIEKFVDNQKDISLKLDVESLPAGIYNLMLIDGQEVRTASFEVVN